MTLQESILSCFARYADFDGEAPPSEFWWFFVFVAVVNTLIYAVSPKASALFFLATLLPLLAVGARRLHDTNRSGWWQLAWFVPMVGWLGLAFLFIQPGETTSSSDTASR
jgi:uncharacterized membrane protein YhaH (DUF805 family)